MNDFHRNKYKQEELASMQFKNQTINTEKDKYKEMYKIIKYAYIPK